MKTPEIDIANFLSAYDVKTAKSGIKLWVREFVAKKGILRRRLKEDGWYRVSEKPKDREYYLIDGEYWVQDPKKHEEMTRELVTRTKNVGNRRKTKTDLSDIRQTELLCPICGGELFRQLICPGCREGKQGYRVRLICGEDANHEFLV